ncbi:unnamed protein product [Closterium sp. Naga37s-1]|nr:unnamed protein product [Closterium sp. Naga37s-1]
MLPPSTISILILTTPTPSPQSCGRVKSRPSALFVYGGALPMSSSTPKPVVQLAASLLRKQSLSPSPPPLSLTWADFDSLPPATTPSPLPAPSTVSDPPSPASPSSTTQSPPLLPAPEPIPLKTYQRRPPAAAPAPDPPPAPDLAPAPDSAAALDAATTPPASPPPAPPPSPIAGRTRSHKAPKPLSLSIRVSLNPPPAGGDYSLMTSLLEDRHELIDIDSAIHALCSLFPDIAESPTLNFSDNPSHPHTSHLC